MNLLAFIRCWQKNINGQDVVAQGRRGTSSQYVAGVRRGKDPEGVWAKGGSLAKKAKKSEPPAASTKTAEQTAAEEAERRVAAVAAAAQGYLNPYMF